MNVKISECIAPSFYDLHKELKKDELTEIWLRGGRGSCKSSFTSIECILELIKDPEANGIAFRRFENEIRDSVFAQLQWATHILGVDHLFKFQISPFKVIYEPTGQMIIFKGADNPKKIKSIKLATGYVKFVWMEEVDQFTGMAEVRNILQSILRGTTKRQMVIFSYNPPKSARSWVNAESKLPKENRLVHYSDYRTVPKDWLGDTFLTNAEHLKEVNEDAYKHEYLGEETGTGLEVFNNVTLRPITDKEITYFDHRYQGLDMGYTIDPMCFIQGNFDAKTKTLSLFYEYSGIGIKNSKLLADLSADRLADVTMMDSANPKEIDELRDMKMNVVGADKAPGSVEHGTKYLQDLEEIIIDPIRCPLAAKEFINYALNVDRFGEPIGKFPDKDNHSLDACRYMLSLQITQAKIEKRKNKFKIHSIPVLNRWG